MKSIQKFLAIPFWRLSLSLFLIVVFSSFLLQGINMLPGLSQILGNEYFLILSALLISMMIENLRAGSKWYHFGIRFDSFTIRDFLLGFLIVSVIFIIFFFTKQYFSETITMTNEFDIKTLFLLMKGIFLAVLLEEIVSRGIIFQALIDMWGVYVATTIISILFTFLHLFNPQINYIAIINTFLASIVLCAMYFQTKSLWLPISFHFFWNLFQPLFIGSNISGLYVMKLFTFSSVENIYINRYIIGGDYGIEGSILCTFVLGITLFITLKFIKPAAYISSELQKRQLAESKVRYEKN